MVASRQTQPLLSSDDTQEVIGSRIREKRLFEARFLCRKLGQGLTAEQRASFEHQLAQALKRVETLRAEAKALFGQGEYASARTLYEQVVAIAIDVPGVSEEIKNLAGAEALALRLAPAARPSKDEQRKMAAEEAAREDIPPVVIVVQEPLAVQGGGGETVHLIRRRGSAGRGMVVGAGLALFVALALVVFFLHQKRPVQPPATAQPEQEVLPLTTELPREPVLVDQQQPLVIPAPQPDPVGKAPDSPSDTPSPASKQEPDTKNGPETPEKPSAKKVQKGRAKPVAGSAKPSLNLGGLKIE
nr:hypothetical protein [uncultured Desulfobulbus sp.]